MPRHSSETEYYRQRGAGEANLRHWHRLFRRLPAVRMDKVLATRDALRRRCYENEEALDTTVRRMSNDVGVLCRG